MYFFFACNGNAVVGIASRENEDDDLVRAKEEKDAVWERSERRIEIASFMGCLECLESIYVTLADDFDIMREVV